MPHERLRPSFVFDEERLKQLQQITPEAFADGKINWDVLKEALGERLEEEGDEAEHFGLFWPGKREARKIASIPSKGTLVPVKGEGINEDSTKNIFIEGENFEILKLLQKSYAGKIKMIYIDPPYNTGNDFIYDDNFIEPLEEYLKYTGQMDPEGKLLTTNKRADGRFHSKWLSMMYPRLRLVRNLLREDGIIFISIDDNEICHLRALMNEVFGEENIIQEIIWQRHAGGGNDSRYFAVDHEYILCYAKNKTSIAKLRIPLSEDEISEYTLKDKHFKTLGPYKTKSFYRMRPDDPRPGLQYHIKMPNGSKLFGEWKWEESQFLKALEDEKVIMRKDSKGKWIVEYKIYLNDEDEEERLKVPRSMIIKEARNSQGKSALTEVMGEPDLFNNPKPIELIQHLAKIATKPADIICDFFAGSCSTAHAILELDKECPSGRKFICVQMPELCDQNSKAFKAGYKNIAALGEERIRRVVKTLKRDKKNIGDLGFRKFELEKSCFTQWQNYDGTNIKQVEDLFKSQENPLVNGWRPENLLVEVMLQEGFPLDSDIEELKDLKKNKVMQVSSSFCQHKLLVSFDKKMAQDTIDNFKIEGEDIFVCLDNALTDEQKVTLSDKGFLKTI